MRIALFLIFVLAFAGCATSGKINKISIGMTKEQAIQVMGKPDSVSATSGTEYLNYRLSETSDHAFYGITTPYFVRIIDGKVESFGRLGDFDSTKSPSIQIQSEQNIKADVTISKSSRDGTSNELEEKLKQLKRLRDKGALTAKEYDDEREKLMKLWRNN